MQIVERFAKCAVGLGQTRPRLFVAAPSEAAQQGGEKPLCALFVLEVVAEFMIAQQNARVRRKRQCVIRCGARPFCKRMRVAAPPFRRGNRHLAAADDQRVKGHVVAEKHCIEPAVPCADGVAQTAVHLLKPVGLFHLQLRLHRSDKAKHCITLSSRLSGGSICAVRATIFHVYFTENPAPCVINLFYRTFAHMTRAYTENWRKFIKSL